jgi:hypothetical protein
MKNQNRETKPDEEPDRESDFNLKSSFNKSQAGILTPLTSVSSSHPPERTVTC